MSKKRFELQIPARLYEKANAKAQSWHTCEDCRYFEEYDPDGEDFTICTNEVAHKTEGDKIHIEYKKVEAEDIACEYFQEDF